MIMASRVHASMDLNYGSVLYAITIGKTRKTIFGLTNVD